jgi:hypothetical protein
MEQAWKVKSNFMKFEIHFIAIGRGKNLVALPCLVLGTKKG